MVILSLLENEAVLTLEHLVNLATLGANVAMRGRDLRELLLEWIGSELALKPAGSWLP